MQVGTHGCLAANENCTRPSQTAKGHAQLALVLTQAMAEFRKAIASAMKLFLNREVLTWTSLYLTPEGMRQVTSWEGFISYNHVCLAQTALGIDCAHRGYVIANTSASYMHYPV